MNTAVDYLYRDASNYQMPQHEVIKGLITEDQITRILTCLYDGEYFIPSQVGLSEKRFADTPTDDDHCWFELDYDSFQPTEEEPTVNMTPLELADKFDMAADKWDETAWLSNL